MPKAKMWIGFGHSRVGGDIPLKDAIDFLKVKQSKHFQKTVLDNKGQR